MAECERDKFHKPQNRNLKYKFTMIFIKADTSASDCYIKI